MINFEALMASCYNGREEEIPERLLCLDPGQTTGWCLFEKGKLTAYGQIDTITEKGGENGASCILHWDNFLNLFNDMQPTHVVVENYRVYGHKLDRHTFSEVGTVRLIGGIDLICHSAKTGVYYQMAMAAKGFVSDDKLKTWGFWKTGMRHSRDAIRHGIYYLIVTNKRK